MDAGRIRDGVDVHPGDVERGTVRRQLGGRAPGRLDHDERMARVELLQALVAADEPRRANPRVAAGGVPRLVDALPDRRARGAALRPFTTVASRRSRSDGLHGAGRGGRSVRSPSQSQPKSPCDAAASSFCAFELRSARAPSPAPQAAVPVRIRLTPAAATSASPLRPLSAPCGSAAGRSRGRSGTASSRP